MLSVDWIVWNSESRSILHVGTQSQMEEKATHLNTVYQTDAYVAKQFILTDPVIE